MRQACEPVRYAVEKKTRLPRSYNSSYFFACLATIILIGGLWQDFLGQYDPSSHRAGPRWVSAPDPRERF